jgi:NADH-quinone oxidoreductase subunit H
MFFLSNPIIIIQSLIIIITVLISVAYFTLSERKVLGSVQRRKGPDVVGILGLLQPLSDGLKLFIKETIIPSNSDTFLFLLAPLITFILSLLTWSVLPLGFSMVLSDFSLGILYIFAVSSLEVYGVILAGWSSNSRYAFLGSLRTVAQMISYEISIGFVIISLVILSGSSNLSIIVEAQEDLWYCIPLFPMFLIFIISMLAETNRHPFDLPEAESELVSGYNVEYSGMSFALFFLGEYSSMLLMSCISVIFFFGGWFLVLDLEWFSPFVFGLKSMLFIFIFVWARAALPRYRYDQLMRLGWKVFCPFTLAWTIFLSSFVVLFNI